MTHSVELLFDDAAEAGVRDLWERMRAAGLPGLADHRHPTNRPHVTLVAATSLTGLPPLPLPINTTIAGVRLLGRAVVRELALPPGLRELHAAVWGAVGSANPYHAPARWVPHVSLALTMPERHRAAALALLSDLPPVPARLVAARTYDSDARAVRDLTE